MKKELRRKTKLDISLLLFACLLSANTSVFAADVNSLDALKDAIENATSASLLREININGDLNIDGDKGGNKFILNSDGSNHRAFNLSNNAKFEISNLDFKNFEISETNVSNEKGAVIFVTNGTLRINSSVFSDNNTDLVHSADGSNGVTQGAAVYVDNGTVEIVDSEFARNRARRGGAFATLDNGSVEATVTGSTFSENYADFAGGAISNGSSMTIQDSTFSGNSAGYEASNSYENGGGAISNTGSIIFEGTNEFLNNTSDRNGGAIINRTAGEATVSFDGNVLFENNSTTNTNNVASIVAYGGGAIFNNNTVNFGSFSQAIDSLIFKSNSTAISGGAIYNKGIMSIYGGSNFGQDASTGNSALAHGGAIFNYNNSHLSINSLDSQSRFMYNVAGKYGGAIYNSGVLSLIGTQIFQNNKSGFTKDDTGLSATGSGSGGAIYNLGSLTIEGVSSFKNNVAVGYGGAIYNQGDLTITGKATFENNLACSSGSKVYGGAISVVGGSLTLIGTRDPENNNAASISFKNNASISFNDSNALNSAIDKVVLGAGDFNYNESNYTSAKTGYGGAVSVVGAGSTAYISGVDFEGNKSDLVAGAIRCEGSSGSIKLYVDDAVFTNNSSIDHGGAISSGGTAADIYIANSKFNGNYTTNTSTGTWGGTITNGHYLKIINSTFEGNHSKSNGGAIGVNGQKLDIVADGADTKFSGNYVDLTSGRNYEALYLKPSSATSMTVNFNAGNGGNIIFDDKIRATSTQTVHLNNNSNFVPCDDERPELSIFNSTPPTNGSIIFNNTLTNLNLILHDGELVIGKDTSKLLGSDKYFGNKTTSLELAGGVLNLANGNIEGIDSKKIDPKTVTVTSNAELKFDVDLANEKIDYIDSVITGNGNLKITNILFNGDLKDPATESGELANVALPFAQSNTVNTSLLETLQTVITSRAGYSLSLTPPDTDPSTITNKNTLYVTKTISAGGLPVAVSIGKVFPNSTYVYSATEDEEIEKWDITYTVVKDDYNPETDDKRTITGTNILQGDQLVINGNDKKVISSKNSLPGIVVGLTKSKAQQVLTINNVKEWKGFSSAVINEGGILNVEDSTFESNINSTENGGAIRNAGGVVNLLNTNFKDNTAVKGGAIYNGNKTTVVDGVSTTTTGIVNILSKNLGDVIFSGNNSDIYNDGGIVNIAADATSKITFNDSILGSNGQINIGYTGNENLGTVIFKNTISDNSIVLNGGTLQLNPNDSVNSDQLFGSNVNLTLNGGTFDIANGKVNNLSINELTIGGESVPNLSIDVNLSGSSDKLVIASDSTISGTLNIDNLNLIGTMASDSITATFINKEIQSSISSPISLITVDDVTYIVSVNKNQLTISKTGQSQGFAYEVAINEALERSYQIGEENTVVSSWIKDNNLIGNKFHISGGAYQNSLIAENSIEGIVVGLTKTNFPQELTVSGVNSYEGFNTAFINNGGNIRISGTTFRNNASSNDGGVIRNNSGNVYISGGTTFEDNSAVQGGAIYNNANLHLNVISGKDIVFVDNNVGVDANGNTVYNDIYQTSTGNTYITNQNTTSSTNNGSVIINGGISGTGSIVKRGYGDLVLNSSSDNSGFTGTFNQYGVGEENSSFGGNVIVRNGATFFGGTSTINNSTLIWETANELVGTLNITNKGKLVVGDGTNNALLKISGNSDVASAQTITINRAGTLQINKNMTFANTITGSGVLELNGKTLTLTSNASINSDINFTSKNASVVLSNIANATKADNLLSAIMGNNDSNSGLKITLNNTDSNSNFFVDNTTLKSITFKDAVNYGGEITGTRGSVTNTGTLNITADESGYTGTFNQTGASSSTTIASGAKVFSGNKNINEGSLSISSSSAIDYTKVHLSDNTQLTHTALSATNNTITGSVVDFVGTGAKALFTTGNNVIANYLLDADVADANNTVAFENSVITLGTNNYSGKYEIKNSTLDLTSTASSDYTFDSLDVLETNKLNITANIIGTSDPNVRALETDTLTIANGTANFNLGKITITGDENGQTEYGTTKNVLSGATFTSPSNPELVVSSGATTLYEYIVELVNDAKSIKLSTTGITNENSLYRQNAIEGNRFFQFSIGDTGEYHIGQSLGKTASGDFYISGRSSNAQDSVLSGAIVDSTGALTGAKGSFFNIDSTTNSNLHIADLTIQDAQKIGNGAVVYDENPNSIVNITNAIVKNNSVTGNGGALYLAGNTTIKDTIFENNAATGNGGAIYNKGKLSLEGVTIKAGTVDAKNDIYQEGGSTILNGTNIIESAISGTGSITNTGNFTTSGDNSNYTGTFSQNTGLTTVKGTFFGRDSTIDGGILNWLTDKEIPGTLTVNKGIVSIGDSDIPNAVLSINNNSSIASEADVYINAFLDDVSGETIKSTLSIDGGTVTLDSNDVWNGEVVANSGTLNLNGVNNGTFKALGGTVNLNSGGLIIDSTSSIAGDSINNAAFNIADGSQLIILGGNVTLDNNDIWDGDVYLADGDLTVADISSNAKLFASAGNLNIKDDLSVENGSYILGNVKTVIDGNLKIKDNGIVSLNDSDDSWNNTITLDGGVLNYSINNNGTLKADSGYLNLAQDSLLNLETISSYIDSDVKVNLVKGANINLADGAKAELDDGDNWSGVITNNGGTLATIGLHHATANNGSLQQNSGTTVFDNKTVFFINDTNSYINGGDVKILNDSIFSMGANASKLIVDNLTMANNSTFDLINNNIETSTVENMIVNNSNNFTIDIDPRNWASDSFILDKILSDSQGTINISNFNFVGKVPIDRNITLNIFNANDIQDVEFTATNKHIDTPIGRYQLFSNGGGSYNATMTSYNPQVFRGQVATMAAYNNQLLIGDMVLNHFILPNEREIDLMARHHNSYASASTIFSPYLKNSLEEGGLWTKNYVSFENLSLTNNLNVGNNIYGTLIGADFPLVNLKNGWKFIPTAYVGYNGANQNFSHVSMYQNGGQGGFMGTFTKKDFIGAITAYAGGYSNEMHVNSTIDTTGNWFAGTMAKAAYNIRPTKHFIIQPTALIAYNLFGKQKWNTDFGEMSMNSGLLNGINVAPGINLIYSRDTWSVYGAVQYMYNINEGVGGGAGNVNLAKVDMKHGYIQYGVGVTKTWKDRLSGFFQINLRNGGRTGVGLQLGLKLFMGKDKPKPSQSPKKTVIKSR